MTDFRNLIEVLVAARVEFIVVGGLAATVHGSARLTQDVDIVYARTADNIARLVEALAPHRPALRDVPSGMRFVLDAPTVRSGLNFTLTTSIGDLDLFGELMGGETYESLAPHTIEIVMFGQPCRCLDLPTLIAVKRAAGRRKDLEAVAELEALDEERRRQDRDRVK